MSKIFTEKAVRAAWDSFAFELRVELEAFGYSVSQGNNQIRPDTGFTYGPSLAGWGGRDYPADVQLWVPSIFGYNGSYANAGVVLQSAFTHGVDIVCNGYFNISAPNPNGQGYFVKHCNFNLLERFIEQLRVHALPQDKKRKSGIWITNSGTKQRDIRRVPIS